MINKSIHQYKPGLYTRDSIVNVLAKIFDGQFYVFLGYYEEIKRCLILEFEVVNVKYWNILRCGVGRFDADAYRYTREIEAASYFEIFVPN